MKHLILTFVLMLGITSFSFAEDEMTISTNGSIKIITVLAPDIEDYIFKYEKGTLYWSFETDCEEKYFSCCALEQEGVRYNFDECMEGFDCCGCWLKTCNWKTEIPGPLLRELIKK